MKYTEQIPASRISLFLMLSIFTSLTALFKCALMAAIQLTTGYWRLTSV
jgi:hypothetical protein